MVIDPVCGMRIDTDDAVATAERDGQTFYFCSQMCHDAFLEDTAGSAEDRISEGELADRTGGDVGRIRRLVELGMLKPEDGSFRRRDVMRVRVIGQLEETGLELTALAAAMAAGHLTLGYMEASGRRHPRADRTFTEVGASVGVPFATLERLYVAFGLPRPSPDEQVRMEDLEALRILPVLLEVGLEEAEIMRMARVWGDSMRRAAQYLPRYFHSTIEERFRQRGMRDNEAFDAALTGVGVRVGQSGEDLLGWLFRRHSEVFQAAHQLEHVETALDDANVRPRPAPTLEAAVFADLSGFTHLTEIAGDEAAAEMALSLGQLAGEIASRHGGSVVKLLGDGVLLHFADAGDALAASLDLIEQAPSQGLPPTHIGVNAGPMLYDQGDFFGRTVNIAARLAARADAGQILVGEGLVAVCPEGVQLREIGPVELKGIAQPVRVFEAVRA